VAYSTLVAQDGEGLNYIYYRVNFSIYRHLLKHFAYKRYLIVRNPYNRFLSLFADKYRKQPQRILDKLHTWEKVHTCLFPYLGISPGDADDTIARAFMNMQISDFLAILPKVINEDEHFMPQMASRQLKLSNQISINLKINGSYRLEDQQDELSRLTGIDFGVQKNKSNSTNYKNVLTNEDLEILNNLYKQDFGLGKYEIITQ
jgi:hypothetical protein